LFSRACGVLALSLLTSLAAFGDDSCGPNPNQLCLVNGRYRVTLEAYDDHGKTAPGVPKQQTSALGYFSLPGFTGDERNPEVFVKIVEPQPGKPWVFYSGLTNLRYSFAIIDTHGPFSRVYDVSPPPPGSFQSYGNFDVEGVTSTNCANVTTQFALGVPTACVTAADRLCLLNRYSVTLQAKDNPTRTTKEGPGAAVPVNDVFGFFTVPALSANSNDIQAFVKMVDARSFDGRFWVFLGGLTDFELTFTVYDTQIGRTKIYRKPAGSTCGWNDTQAFD
jgi:hypothetical protein